jgi:predicted amidophosphoribosyltransferase
MNKLSGIILKGSWYYGEAIDYHFKEQKDNLTPESIRQRTNIAIALNDLRYKEEYSAIYRIIQEIDKHKKMIEDVDAIVSVPPTNLLRKLQHVELIAENMSLSYKKPLIKNAIRNIGTVEIKKIEPCKRRKIQAEKLIICNSFSKLNRILLFDDVFDTGSTLETITQKIIQANPHLHIMVFTLTKYNK